MADVATDVRVHMACVAILGKKFANRMIRDHGLHWCAIAAQQVSQFERGSLKRRTTIKRLRERIAAVPPTINGGRNV